jgi:hypothetical protein
MKCVARLLTALVAMWAVSGHAQIVFPISENDVDVPGIVLMCPKSNIYAPCPLQPRLRYACAGLMNLDPTGVCKNWFRASLPALLASSQEAN